MVRQFCVLIIVSALLICCSDNKPVNPNPIPKDTNMVTVVPKNYMDFDYSKVIAFATVVPYDYYDLYFSNKMDLAKFHDTISKTLDSTQTVYLNKILSGYYRKPYPKGGSNKEVADCFYPRHNIIFLDRHDSVVNFISICFECGNTKESKDDLANMDNYKMFFNSIGLPAIERPDLYKEYYDSLNKTKRATIR